MMSRVLLVDDSEELLDVYREGLEAAGYAVDTALSAERALEIARTCRPDVVITDVCMPGMSGLDLITHIRSDLAPPVPRLVVLSGFPRAEGEALERGAQRFLLKPLGLADLMGIVSEVAEDRPAVDPAMRQAQVKCRAQARSFSHAAYAVSLADPSFAARATRMAHWLSAYLGHSAVLVLTPQNGTMQIVISSNTARFPHGAVTDELLALSSDVLESGSRLVVTDVAASKAFFKQPASSIRFLVCVPLVISGMPLGVLCIADDRPHSFDSSELAIVEGIAATAAPALARPQAPRWFHHSGVFSKHALTLLVAKGTEWAADRGGCSGLLLVETPGLPLAESCSAILDEVRGPRMAIGAISDQTLAVFVSDATCAGVAERLETARVGIGRHIPELASSRLAFEAPIPRLLPDVLVTWGLGLLAHANTSRPGACILVDCRVSHK